MNARKEKRKESKKWYALCLLVALLLLLTAFVVWWKWEQITTSVAKSIPAQFLAIRAVRCKTQYGPCEEQDVALASRFVGENVFLVSHSDIEETVSQNFKNRKVFVHTFFPYTLSLVIEKRKASVAIGKENIPSGVFLISNDGMTLAFEPDSALPQVIVSEDVPTPVVGQAVSGELIEAGNILALLSKVQRIVKTTFRNGTLTAEIISGQTITVLFPLDRDAQVIVGALQLILEQAKMKNKIPRVIDLRYKNPVLIY